MSLKHLAIDPDVIQTFKKELTPFEMEREAAKTYEELVALGYKRGMEFPENWATHVLVGRRKSHEHI
jgi:hypothetical protein